MHTWVFHAGFFVVAAVSSAVVDTFALSVNVFLFDISAGGL